MRTLSSILNLGFLISRTGLLYRLDKNRNSRTSLLSSLLHNFSEVQSCDELRQLVKLLVSMIVRVIIKNLFQRSCCTISKCSLSLTHFRVMFYHFCAALNSAAVFVPLSTQIFLGRFFFVIMFSNARTVSLQTFVFIRFSTTVLSKQSRRTSEYFTPL